MGRVWKVVKMTGEHAVVELGRQRIDIPRPKDYPARSMFMKLRMDMTIDDEFLEVILRPKLLPNG